MITFKISLILAFSIKRKTEPKKKDQPKKNNKKQEANKKLKNKKSKSDEIGKLELVQFYPRYVFEVEEPHAVAHIEYELIPHKLKYSIDVKCWGPVAKIFTADGQITLKTVMKGDMIWVPICLEHYVQHLSLVEIKDLRNHVVKFDMVTNEHKLGKIAASDKSKIFYARSKEADLKCFVEVYDQDPNLTESEKNEPLQEIVENIITKCINFSEYDYATKLQFLNNDEQIYEIINKHSAGIEVDCRDFVLPCVASQEPVKKVKLSLNGKNIKIDKKAVQEKLKTKDKKNAPKIVISENFTLSIPAEIFFTDQNWVLYKEHNDNCVLKNVYASVCVEHLLSRTQKLALDPLVIKIKKLSNVPVNLLAEMGIKSVYASYNVPFVADCTTVKKPLKQRIRFDEAHIFFNDNISKLKLIEFMQSKRLLVEIHGIRDVSHVEPKVQLFGNSVDDKNISKIKSVKKLSEKIHTPSYGPTVLIAVCTYDLSSVVQNVWEFKEKGQCHVPGLTLYQACHGFYEPLNYFSKRNVNEINLHSNDLQMKPPVSEEMLLHFVTTLKVEVYLMAPQTASLILLRIPNTFKRFLFTIPYWELAKNLLTSIIRHNDDTLSTTKGISNDKDLEFLDILTGFVIDHENNFTFFVEGLSSGFILSIENVTIVNFEVEKSKFFFNTDTVFEKRLYGSFIREGLNILTLKVPIYKILKDRRVFLNGNVPMLCMEALKKLYLLFHCAIFKSIMQFNLLPRPEELLSLNLEWGVPLLVK